MEALFSNNIAVVSVCITVLILVILLSKFTNGFKVSKDGIELAKKDTSINIRHVIQESLHDLDVRLGYLSNGMISRYPKKEYLIRYDVSLIKDLGERILFFNNVKDDEEYIQFRLTTLNTLIDSFGSEMLWDIEKIEKQFREWIKNICYLKQSRDV